MLSQLKSYLFGATDGVMMQQPAEGDCKTNGEDDWVLVDTQGNCLVIELSILSTFVHEIFAN